MILLLALTACGMNEYHPAVTASPKNASYERDLRECIQYSKDVRSKPNFANAVISGSFGLVGSAAMAANHTDDDPYYKSGFELTDECLVKKGYSLASR